MALIEKVYLVASDGRLSGDIQGLADDAAWELERFERFESFLEIRNVADAGALLIDQAQWTNGCNPPGALRERADLIPVLVLLESDDAERAVEIMRSGALDVLLPHIESAALADRIVHALHTDRRRRERQNRLEQMQDDLSQLSQPAQELITWMFDQLSFMDRRSTAEGKGSSHHRAGSDGRADAANPPWIEELPPRLRETLDRLRSGYSEKQIAFELELSQHTVHDYVKALHKRLQVSSRGELLAKCSGDLSV